MIKLMVLGHNGMLGNAVMKYFSQYPQKYKTLTLSERWGYIKFNEKLISADIDFIINCIGATPQKYSNQPEKYKELNIDLPIFLETLNKKIIHPSTDCEFSGNLSINKKYQKNNIRDATDDYGKSKAYISELIENSFKNTKIIRTSIIGYELTDQKFSLLEWILSSKGSIRGYTDHYWNGITTLQWSKICENIINNWNKQPVLNQYGTEKINNKYDLAKIIVKTYKKNTIVKPYVTGQNINKCLESDTKLPTIDEQVIELKKFYGK
ncbi:MAG: sugar nucleotide-binding protein [bacterium]